MSRTFGIEAEFSDIKTVDAVRLLYELWGRDPKDWRDRHGAWAKPVLDYSVWNCMSDGSLYNSNGTRCMWTYLDPEDGKIKQARATKDSPHRFLWEGVELVSRATDNFPALLDELVGSAAVLIGAGATARPEHFDSIHVHVDLSDLPWTQVASFVPRIYEIQEFLDQLATPWTRKELLTEEAVQDLADVQASGCTKEEFWEAYRTVRVVRGRFKGQKITVPYDDDRQRRIVDIGPYFSAKKPYNTMEFRCFRAHENPEVMTDQVLLAKFIADALIDEKPLDFVKQAVDEIVKGF